MKIAQNRKAGPGGGNWGGLLARLDMNVGIYSSHTGALMVDWFSDRVHW